MVRLRKQNSLTTDRFDSVVKWFCMKSQRKGIKMCGVSHHILAVWHKTLFSRARNLNWRTTGRDARCLEWDALQFWQLCVR